VFDSHVHLDFAGFVGTLAAQLDAASDVGMWFVPGYDLEPQAGEIELRALSQTPAYRGRICWGVGLHPWRVAELDDDRGALQGAEVRLFERARELGAVAIGETGFDRTPERVGSLKAQERAFQICLGLAQELDLPLCLHNVRAEAELKAALRGVRLPSRPGVAHGFSGGLEFATWLVERGFRLGIGLLLLRQLERKQETPLVRCVRRLPLEAFVLETDATGGPRASLSELGGLAKALAQLRGEALEQVQEVTESTACELFAWPRPAKSG